MAVFQIESGVCHGRGFAGSDANGLLAKFKSWVVKLSADGGPGWFLYDDQSALGTNPYIVVCDLAAPVVNAISSGPSGGPPKFLKVGLVTTEAGQIRVRAYHWWNNATHVGYGLWCGGWIGTYDDADFAYDFRGGAECMIIQSRRGTTWDTFVLDEWTGDANLVEGTDKYGVLQGGVSAGSNVVCQLGAGQAANFTVGRKYYIFDFNGVTGVNYVNVVARDLGLDTITIQTLSNNFAANSVIAAYAHRWVGLMSAIGDASDMSYYRSQLPYYSGNPGYVTHDQSGQIFGACGAAVADAYLYQMAPDDEGKSAAQRPGIIEYYRPNYIGDADGMNRGYGVLKNVYLTRRGSMAAGVDGRIIGSKNWIFFKGAETLLYSASSSLGALFLDTESEA